MQNNRHKLCTFNIKMMKTIKEIETELSKISEILHYCRKLTYDSHCMLVAKTNTKHIIIWRDKFLTRTRDSLWFLSIIELSKIYGQNKQNDHFSIMILVAELRKSHSTSKWKEMISSKELKQCAAELKASDIKIRVNKLKELRNQHLAHTDKNPNNNIYNVKFYFDDSTYLIEQAEKMITFLSMKLLSTPITFQEYNGEDVDLFLDNHINYLELAGRYNMESMKKSRLHE